MLRAITSLLPGAITTDHNLRAFEIVGGRLWPPDGKYSLLIPFNKWN